MGLSTSRAVAYYPLMGGPHDGAGPQVLSDHGEWLWLYATLWAVTALIALVELVTGTSKASVLLAIFMCLTWSLSYFAAWKLSNFESADWMTGALYASYGLTFIAVKRLLDVIHRFYAQALTGIMGQIGR